MFRSTEVLIQARSPHCHEPPMVVPVLQHSTGKPNECFANAIAFCRAHPGSLFVAGWLAHEYDATETADFIQHWWNFHQGQHVDTTPMLGGAASEHVVDPGLGEFTVRHKDRLHTFVASSLVLHARQFEIVTHVEGIHVQSRPINDLTSSVLYHAAWL